MAEPLRLGCQPFEALEAVDEQPTHAATFDRRNEPVAGFVEQPFGRRLPNDLDVTLGNQPIQRQSKYFRLIADCCRRLIKPEEQAWIIVIAFAEKMQAERGLADPRRADQQSGRVLRETPAHYPVELRNTRRNRRPRHLIRHRRVRQQCLGTRIDCNPVVGDAERMLASQVTAAPQLMNL